MTIFYFILAAAALGILVFIHELGHYFVARWVGMTVETFSIGFGRPILKWKWQNVDWQIGWLPFGGFVKIMGMEFSKKDRELYNEPYEIPNGFFAKAPWKRIAVALAGPLANFLLALLVFCTLFVMGGREKPFSEFTQIIGWVDPQSEIYAQGVRPGDILTEYNGKPYKSSKDLLYATMLAGKDVQLKGFHVDYATGERRPFDYTIESYPAPGSLDDILTTGITANARYMIYDKVGTSPNVLSEGSPMLESGIQYGDQLVWGDGELLFSMEQVSHLINANKVLLTVKRGDEVFLSRQPRVLTPDLNFPSHVRNELEDWQYESDIKERWSELFVLPYVINGEGFVEQPVPFIDEESRLEAFPLHAYSEVLEAPLEPGDRILSVDGAAVSHGYEILKGVQTHKVQLIAKRNVSSKTHILWSEEDALFVEDVDWKAINETTKLIGTGLHAQDGYVLLNPIAPKKIHQFGLSQEARESMATEMDKQKKQVATIKDQEKRSAAMAYLEKVQNRKLLGIYLQDRLVEYNPNPIAMFGNVFVETGQTLKALVLGYLHPKWLSGPIGIVRVIHHGWKIGIGEALFWIAAISINLGFLNLLPIPVLDGGYVCLALWEWITRRRIKAKTMERLIIPFVVLLIAFLVFLTFQDISRLF
ncbi:MAG: site-2 protease family protein [Chlamydiales bacterium]|nr:site-2 protease family protein [Chlamydiales bacterium]